MQVWHCTNEQYHADLTHDSHSSLDMFSKSVEQYAAIRIHKTVERPPATEAMEFGSLVHTFVLEQEKFYAEYVAEEKFDKRTTKGKAGYAEFLRRAVGKKIVKQEAIDMAFDMHEGILRNTSARILIDGEGKAEQAFRWTDPNTGLLLKMRIDWLTSDGFIADLKTTQDPSPAEWAKSVANFGYHRQAAMYLDGCTVLGLPVQSFVFIAISKTPPHESVCYQLDERSIYVGREQNKKVMHDLAQRKANNDWSGRWSDGIQTLSLPYWAMKV